jgi:hypothetical protein
MKRTLALPVAFALAVVLLMSLGVLPAGPGSYYNKWTGIIRCQGEDCLHEAGHALDASRGWVSEGQAWRDAVSTYIAVAWQMPAMRDQFTETIAFFPGVGGPLWPSRNPFNITFWRGGWGGYTELYAELFKACGGDIGKLPAGLQPFYNS